MTIAKLTTSLGVSSAMEAHFKTWFLALTQMSEKKHEIVTIEN